MEVFFLGVGEACDPSEPNTSVLIKSVTGKNIFMLDCGFTAPHRYYEMCNDPDELTAVWISHFHGDHFFGVPLLLLRMYEMGRTSPLTIFGPQGISQIFNTIMELAYPNCRKQFPFKVTCVEVVEGKKTTNGQIEIRAANVGHSQAAMGVRIDISGKSIYYSGDGGPTGPSQELAQDCNLIIHESYSLTETVSGHCKFAQILDFSGKANCKCLAVVHVNYKAREDLVNHVNRVQIKDHKSFEILVPKSGDRINI